MHAMNAHECHEYGSSGSPVRTHGRVIRGIRGNRVHSWHGYFSLATIIPFFPRSFTAYIASSAA